MPTTSCARPRCPCRAANRCRGRRAWRGAAARSCRSSTSTRWETGSDDGRGRRTTRHLQGGRAGFRAQHLPGGAHPALRGAGPAAQSARFSGGGAAVPGRRSAARGSAQAARRARPAPRGDPQRDPRMGRREARRGGGRGDRGAAPRGRGDYRATRHREGPRRRIHHRSRGDERPHHHRAQCRPPTELEGKARARGGRAGEGQGLMVDSPLSALKEDIRKLVDRFKQVGASTAEASAPEFTGTRPAVHADHIGASTFIEKGWSLISLGDYAGAIQALHRALQLSPGETQAESLLGWAQMLHEEYDDALATFQKVLMKEPANSLARINVGYICLKKRIFGEAIEHLSKTIRLDNDKKATLYAHFYLGLVYLQREMYEDAQTFFQKTLKLGPNLIEAYYELGRAHWFGGDREQAAKTWEDGFKANKFNPWGKKCQETLELVRQGQEPPRA